MRCPCTSTVLTGMRWIESNQVGTSEGAVQEVKRRELSNRMNGMAGRAKPGLFQLHQGLVGFHLLPLGHIQGDHRAVDRGGYPAFHLHGLDDQDRLSDPDRLSLPH